MWNTPGLITTGYHRMSQVVLRCFMLLNAPFSRYPGYPWISLVFGATHLHPEGIQKGFLDASCYDNHGPLKWKDSSKLRCFVFISGLVNDGAMWILSIAIVLSIIRAWSALHQGLALALSSFAQK